MAYQYTNINSTFLDNYITCPRCNYKTPDHNIHECPICGYPRYGASYTSATCCLPLYTSDLQDAINKLKPNKIMKLTTMMKRLLDKDTQVLVKAGFINGDLEITEDGWKNLKTILFLANKKEMVELATEKITEEEKK